MLDKRLQIGGLQVGGPRTAQNSARFRVANNVYQTHDDYMIPRYHGNEYLAPAIFSTQVKVIGLARYLDTLVSVGLSNTGIITLYKSDGTAIVNPPIPTALFFLLGASNELASAGNQYLEKLGCLFLSTPWNNLYKYDGTQYYRAGVPMPWFSCAQYASGGATFIRVIQHHIDFQGNVVNSGYIEFPATPSAGNIVIKVDGAATDIIPNINVSPSFRSTWEKFDGSFDEHFFRASASAPSGTQVVLTTGGNHLVKVGAYILVSERFAASTLTLLPEDSLGIAMKVLSFNATTVTLSLNDVKYLDQNRAWKTANMANTATFLTAMPYGVNYWLSVWSSNVSTGAYVFQALIPALYNSTTAQTFTIGVSTPTVAAPGSETNSFNLAPVLGDIYDVTTVKGVFPRLQAGVLPTVDDSVNYNSCFSTYGDIAIFSYKSEIFFSDVTLGGAFEMVNGLSFITVGEGDDGDLQTICGNADYMFISRQYKNYYLAGNLNTANYRVQEISETSLGGYSNECSIAVAEKIIFFNKQGIWGIFSGGRCEELSFSIKGFFDNYSNTTSFDEETYFNTDSYPTYATRTPLQDDWIRFRFDVARNLLFILSKGDGQGKVLVLNMNNGEFYTWSGMLTAYPFTGTADLKDMVIIDGSYYVTVNYGNGNAVYKENKVIPRVPYNYMSGAYAPKLKTTWFTAGEPSLEKKVKQIKMWGIVNGTIAVDHALDWAQTTSVSDDTYVNTAMEKFSHKKRLAQANALAMSVSMTLNGDRFEFEGFELEFEPFQREMKK